MSVRERIYAIKLLEKKDEYSDYLTEIGVLVNTNIVYNELCVVEKDYIFGENGGAGIC